MINVLDKKITLYVVKADSNFCCNTNLLWDLYLPIVGGLAINFYISLVNNFQYYKKNSNLSFNFNSACKMLGVNSDELNSARIKLEAVGLIKTLLPTNKEGSDLVYLCLNEPLNFYKFLINNRFKTLLINKIGVVNFEYLRYKYCDSENYDDNSINISTPFEQVFNENIIDNIEILDLSIIYNNLQKVTSLPVILDNDVKQIIENVYFNNDLSIDDIENLILDSILTSNNKCICDKDLLLNNLLFFINNGKINHLNFTSLSRTVNNFNGNISDDLQNKIINEYKTINCYNYLSFIFKRALNPNERKILNILKEKYLLSDEIINVIVDFSLYKTNGNLNRLYILKTANTINGLNLKNSSKIIEYFRNNAASNNKKILNSYSYSSMKDLNNI